MQQYIIGQWVKFYCNVCREYSCGVIKCISTRDYVTIDTPGHKEGVANVHIKLSDIVAVLADVELLKWQITGHIT